MSRVFPSAAAIGLMLAACGSVGPPPKTYVLGPLPTSERTVDPLPGRPVIEVKRVLMPDYLDVSDLLIRRGANLVEASPTGRWRERLSVGAAHAIAAGLSRRLPDVVVATNPPPEGAACELLLDVQAFEADTDEHVAFIGQWRLLAASHDTLVGERVSLTGQIVGAGDEAIVAVMSHIMDDVAERVATGIRDVGSKCIGRGVNTRS